MWQAGGKFKKKKKCSESRFSNESTATAQLLPFPTVTECILITFPSSSIPLYNTNDMVFSVTNDAQVIGMFSRFLNSLSFNTLFKNRHLFLRNQSVLNQLGQVLASVESAGHQQDLQTGPKASRCLPSYSFVKYHSHQNCYRKTVIRRVSAISSPYPSCQHLNIKGLFFKCRFPLLAQLAVFITANKKTFR